MMTPQPGFFDLDVRYALLSDGGDPLERLSRIVSFEDFRPHLEDALERKDRSLGGRPPMDAVMMFKILVLQSLYNLGDDAAEYLIRDRLSFMRFLGLGLADKGPDAKTLWLYREHWTQAGVVEDLFERFDQVLRDEGFMAMGGQLVDASIVRAPVQRNRRGENEAIKTGKVPGAWKAHKRAQKDVDARWTQKHAKSYFGYKNHLSVDHRHKLVRRYEVTDAAVHDSQVFTKVLDRGNTCSKVWADSAYRSGDAERRLKENGFISQVHRRGKRNKPLSKHQSQVNARRSRVRARVEHVFAFQESAMGGKLIRTIGIARARTKIGMMNLVYNMRRLVWLTRNEIPARA
jgi:IS5 family transposase